ncbi:MAG: polysaccharide deacetylase [Brevundimonas sp.]|nr:MAG: polysaccharide deacetylase [Brevundimonas sp.]
MTPYAADRSLKGKLRRRLAKLTHRDPARLRLDRPTVSFTFDDVPASAVHNAAPILEERGARGSWYVCAGLFGQDGHMGRFADAGEIGGLVERGHEVGCHTYKHIDCARAHEDDLIADVERNDDILRSLGAEPTHFAFPYGELSSRAKAVLGDRYGSLRGVQSGIVRDGGDRNQLPSVGVQGPGGEAQGHAWLDRLAQGGGWLILFTHDVRETPSPFGCTPEALARLADSALKRGFAIRTVADVLAA